ncbi:MAG: copper resistance protein CopC [Caldilineaceae bacterium]
MRKLTLLFAIGWTLLLAISMPQPTVLAHAEYDHSDPAADAVLTQAPPQVQIWFTQELFRRKTASTIAVYAADGTQVDLDDATIDDDDRKLMRVSLPPTLPDGHYTVQWQATSAEDGHEGQGEFTFTIAATGAAATTAVTTVVTAPVTTTTVVATTAAPATAAPTVAAPEPSPTAAQSAAPASLPCLGGTAPLLLGMVLTAVWRRRRASS